MKMDNGIKKIDTHDLRVNLTRYLKRNKGDIIYITRYNELVAEIKVYNDDVKVKTIVDITKKMVDDLKREKVSMVDARKAV
jgi:hypothetical protein